MEVHKNPNPLEPLEALDLLFQKGLLREKEYQTRKAQIIDRLTQTRYESGDDSTPKKKSDTTSEARRRRATLRKTIVSVTPDLPKKIIEDVDERNPDLIKFDPLPLHEPHWADTSSQMSLPSINDLPEDSVPLIKKSLTSE